MVAIMDSNLDPSSMYHFVSVERDGSTWDLGQIGQDSGDDENQIPRETVMVRSVAMSANVASIMKDEVRHLIRVSGFDSGNPVQAAVVDEEEDMNAFPSNKDLEFSSTSLNSCSHILPNEEGSVVFAVILSRWDDIMGPQTVHAWLEENAEVRDLQNSDSRRAASSSSSAISESRSGISSPCHNRLTDHNTYISKAMKYVTSHTVNYTGISLNSSVPLYVEQESNLFVVPDLELVAQSLGFHVRAMENSVPLSLSILIVYKHYEYFLHLRHLCLQWLRRMAERLHEPLVKSMNTNSNFSRISVTRLNNWVLEFWHTIQSLGKCGLGICPVAYRAEVLNHHLLERALTSHLQTFGCTVIMGTSSADINALISFLSVFLEMDEKFCSRYVFPSKKYSYHPGLFLQGLLLDEFGFRELSSVDLAANQYLVTAVDLTKGNNANAVRQTPPQQINRNGKRGGKHLMHRSILHPVKESACLVKTLMKDLHLLEAPMWEDYITVFKRKIHSLACLLLNLAHHSALEHRAGSCMLQRHLMTNMNLQESDFLIVLAAAEKLKPGIYDCVMDHVLVSR